MGMSDDFDEVKRHMKNRMRQKGNQIVMLELVLEYERRVSFCSRRSPSVKLSHLLSAHIAI